MEFIFRIRSTTFNFNPDSRILILFPHYYSPALTSDGFIGCFFEDKPVSCSIVSERMLEIRSLPRQILINEEVLVKVAGVIQPLYYDAQNTGTSSTSSDNLFISFDEDGDNELLSEIGNLKDIPLTEEAV